MVYDTIVMASNNMQSLAHFRMPLIKSLVASSRHVHILAPMDAGALALAEEGCLCHDVDMSARSMNPLRELWLTWQYIWLLWKIKPQAVLSYTIKPNIFLGLATRFLGIDLIAHVTGLGYMFMHESWKKNLALALFKMAFRRARYVCFLNSADRDMFLEAGVIHPSKAYILPGEGIDTDHYKPQKPRAAYQSTFLLVARMLKDKGVIEFCEAARTLKSEFPMVRCVLLGAFDMGNPSALQQTDIQEWLDDESVVYEGQSDDVRPWIAGSACVVLPSYREGLPRVLLEAGAMAKPCIVSDVPGCQDVIKDQVNGLLCYARDAGSLAQAMTQFMRATQEEKNAWGKAAQERVISDFHQHTVLRSYGQLLGFVPYELINEEVF